MNVLGQSPTGLKKQKCPKGQRKNPCKIPWLPPSWPVPMCCKPHADLTDQPVGNVPVSAIEWF